MRNKKRSERVRLQCPECGGRIWWSEREDIKGLPECAKCKRLYAKKEN